MIRFTLFFLLIFFHTAMAAALTPPPSPLACQTPAGVSAGYQAGFNSGAALAHQVWVKLNEDCLRADEAANAINHLLVILSSALSNPSVYSLCRFTGVTDGLAAFLAAVQDTCSTNCDQDGVEMGTLYAQAYCELSAALDGLVDPGVFIRPPTSPCGDLFESNCDNTFTTTAFVYTTAASVGCFQFTEFPFTAQFSNTRDLVCTYEDVPVAPSP